MKILFLILLSLNCYSQKVNDKTVYGKKYTLVTFDTVKFYYEKLLYWNTKKGKKATDSCKKYYDLISPKPRNQK